MDGGAMLEREFQSRLIKEIKQRFPGSMVLKNDPTYIQGIPDLLVLYKDHRAALECKMCKTASTRPNQQYYVNKMNEMSYAAIVYPENKEEILDGIQKSFESGRDALLSKC
jgi:hypothetical protein